MNDRQPSMAALAASVLASEKGSSSERRVLEKAHAGLAKLVGRNGVDALIARALRLAQRSDARLAKTTVAKGGVLDGLPDGDADPLLLAILTELFELLARFIGEDLARRILGDVWPGVAGGSNRTETKR